MLYQLSYLARARKASDGASVGVLPFRTRDTRCANRARRREKLGHVGAELQIPPAPGAKYAARRVAALAARQFGVISRRQLIRCGASSTTIGRWVGNARLHRVARGVYAVGHPRLSMEARLSVALLRAGAGAALSHLTAAWWWELLRYPPNRVHVSSPGTARSSAAVRVHHPARIERSWHRGLPTVSVTQALIQIAPLCSEAALRRAVAQADHRGWLDRPALDHELARGPRGARRLCAALERNLPQLAETLSPLEDRFLLLCERYEIPLPLPNFEIDGHMVDAYWPDARLAVELDGRDVHGKPAAVVRDRARELALRRAKVDVIRYSADQVDHEPSSLAWDLRTALAEGRTTQARRSAEPQN